MVSVDISNVVLETDHLRLRFWRDTDLSDFFEYAGVDGVGEMAGWPHHESIEVSKTVLDCFLNGKNVFAIELKANHKVIGSLGFHQPHSEYLQFNGLQLLEIGYVLAKEYWGQGYMVEAVKRVLEYGFTALNLDVILVGHFDTNYQSRRVIEKCGFQYLEKGIYESKQLNQSFPDTTYYLLNYYHQKEAN